MICLHSGGCGSQLLARGAKRLGTVRQSPVALTPQRLRGAGVLLVAGAGSAVLFAMPFVLPAYPLIILADMLIFAIACMGLNLAFGMAGLLSFGHATFFGVSAYVGAFLVRFTPVNSFEIYFVAGLSFSLLLAAAIGFFCVRATRIFFTMLTIAFCQTVHSLFVNGAVFGLFGGEGRAIYQVTEGSMYVPRLSLVGMELGPHAFIPAFYNVVVLGFLGAFALLWRIGRSPFGNALRAIRDNETRATFIGIPVRRYRFYAFVLAGLFTSLAGALYGQLTRQITPEQLDWVFSAKLVLSNVVGGVRYLSGPILGAVVFVGLEEEARRFPLYADMILGALLIVVVFAFPQGIAGMLRRLSDRGHARQARHRRRPAPPA